MKISVKFYLVIYLVDLQTDEERTFKAPGEGTQ